MDGMNHTHDSFHSLQTVKKDIPVTDHDIKLERIIHDGKRHRLCTKRNVARHAQHHRENLTQNTGRSRRLVRRDKQIKCVRFSMVRNDLLKFPSGDVLLGRHACDTHIGKNTKTNFTIINLNRGTRSRKLKRRCTAGRWD